MAALDWSQEEKRLKRLEGERAAYRANNNSLRMSLHLKKAKRILPQLRPKKMQLFNRYNH